MPSCCSSTCSGPISARRISARRWPSTPGAKGDSVPVLRESVSSPPVAPAPVAPASRRFRWGDLRKRALSAAVLAPFALACLWFGAWWWTALVALIAVGLGTEWVALCGARLTSWMGAAVPALVLGAAAAALAGHAAVAVAVLAAGFLLAWRVGGHASLAAGIPYL